MNRRTFIKKAGAVFLALAFWQIAAMVIRQDILLVSPVQVLLRLCTIWQTEYFFSSVWFTFCRITAGFLIGLLAGVIFALLADRFEIVETLLWPWVVTIKTVPVASFVVICLIWLSAKNLSVFIAFLIVFPIVYQNVLSGLKAKDRKLAEMAEVFQVRGLRCFRAVIMPGLKEYLLTACSITIGMAWKAGVAAEIIGTPNGSVGKQLYTAKIYLDTDDLLAWTVVLVLLCVVSEKLFMMLMRRICGVQKENGIKRDQKSI